MAWLRAAVKRWRIVSPTMQSMRDARGVYCAFNTMPACQAISSTSFRRMVSANCAGSLTETTKEPGPPMTQSS